MCGVSGADALAGRVPLPYGHAKGWELSTSNSIAALQLQKQLGLGSYKSAWLLCGKLRRAMVAHQHSPLAGLVEIDETVIPHRTKADPPAGRHGRSAEGKMLVAAAVAVHDGGPGRVRLAAIADCSARSLHAFVEVRDIDARYSCQEEI